METVSVRLLSGRCGRSRRASSQPSYRVAVRHAAGTAIARWVEQGLATDDGHRVRLTRAGLLVCDGLWADVLAAR